MKDAMFITGVLLICSLEYTIGCFITNCPPGGKRSGSDVKLRNCEQCGPPGMNGQCYGPHICCSASEGCLMGTIETAICLQENLHTTPCQNPGESCSGNDEVNPINGQCAAFGVCCSSETCTRDINCQNQQKPDAVGEHFPKLLPHFLVNLKHFSGVRKPHRILPPLEMLQHRPEHFPIPEGAGRGSTEDY